MRYGYFDNEAREYVIDKIDVPCSWTNYIGVHDMCGVFNHTAGGYIFYKNPEIHRITRFRANSVPMDQPGHYIYLRDDQSGDYWSVSWQPVARDKAKYSCRHGLSYVKYISDYSDIHAEQKLFVAMDDPVELWDVTIRNDSDRERTISTFSYLEFSYHMIDSDNKNFQAGLYSTGSRYIDGVIEYEHRYEDNSFQFFTSGFEPDGYDCLREKFIGRYRTEANPEIVEKGECTGSEKLGGNHCGCLQKKLTLQPGESVRLIYLLGEGKADNAKAMRKKYGTPAAVDAQFAALAKFWADKLDKMVVKTPSDSMNTMLNIWNLYQSEINVMFSRFSSFVEVGGRTGLGYRDTAQDAMCIPHSNPDKCRGRIVELLRALTTQGYGLHLFEPRWFDPVEIEKERAKKPAFKSPTGVPQKEADHVHELEDACADDALWLVASVVNYIKETGDIGFANEVITYADGGEGTVLDHLTRILDFSDKQVGKNGICKGLKADWNDCLNLGGGESAMVSFLHHWAILNYIELCKALGLNDRVETYTAMAEKVKKICEDTLWDGKWYLRGFTAQGRKIGTDADSEGKVHMECNTWAVISGVASYERGRKAMDAVDEYLYTPYGLVLNAPSFTVRDDTIGFVTRVYPGLKENGAVFSHPNPWAWCAEAVLGNGTRAMKFYDALCPCNQNDMIEVREAEPYTYCQFITGPDHPDFGTAHHPFMTGSSGWAYFAATQYLLGIRPDFDGIKVDPCVPAEWKEYTVERQWRGAKYIIHVTNPNGVEKGVKSITVDGKPVEKLPVLADGSVCSAEVVMG